MAFLSVTTPSLGASAYETTGWLCDGGELGGSHGSARLEDRVFTMGEGEISCTIVFDDIRDVSHVQGSLSATATQGWTKSDLPWPQGASDVAALCLVNQYVTDGDNELGWECVVTPGNASNNRFVTFELRAKDPEGPADASMRVTADLLIVNKDLIGVSKIDYTLTSSNPTKDFDVDVGNHDGVIFNEVREYRDQDGNNSEASFQLTRANPFSGVGTVEGTRLGNGTVKGRVVSLWSLNPGRVELRTISWGAKGTTDGFEEANSGFTFRGTGPVSGVVVSLDTLVYGGGDDDDGVRARIDVVSCPRGTAIPKSQVGAVVANCMIVEVDLPGNGNDDNFYGGTALVFETGTNRAPGPGDTFEVFIDTDDLGESLYYRGRNQPIMFMTPEHWAASGALPASALPAQALPAQALPAQLTLGVLLGTIDLALPAQAIPSNAIPSNAIPSNAIPSNALPAQAIPSNLVLNAIPSNFTNEDNDWLGEGAAQISVTGS